MEDFPDLCRVCMSKNKNMKSLFDAELSQTADEIEFCTGILISKHDELPKSMCDICFDNLSVAHKFKKACLYANDVYKTTLSQQALLNSIEGVNQQLTKEVPAENVSTSADDVQKNHLFSINRENSQQTSILTPEPSQDITQMLKTIKENQDKAPPDFILAKLRTIDEKQDTILLKLAELSVHFDDLRKEQNVKRSQNTVNISSIDNKHDLDKLDKKLQNEEKSKINNIYEAPKHKECHEIDSEEESFNYKLKRKKHVTHLNLDHKNINYLCLIL